MTRRVSCYVYLNSTPSDLSVACVEVEVIENPEYIAKSKNLLCTQRSTSILLNLRSTRNEPEENQILNYVRNENIY
jgi:hypothetical protein